jgi:hypothetical protein
MRPTQLILQDLQWAEKLHEEDLHLQELGIAALSSLTLNINRDPKTPPVKSSDFHHFMRSRSTSFSGSVCDTFVSLSKDGLLPSFFYDIIPAELLQRLIDGKKTGHVADIRALVNERMIFIAPSILNGSVSVPFGVIEASRSSWAEFRDIDTGERYEIDILLEEEAIDIPHAFNECSWSIRKSLIILN